MSRYAWDIAARKPTVATIMLGMNDVNRGLYKPGTNGLQTEAKRTAAIQSHIKNMQALAERLHSAEMLKTIRENNAPLPQRYTTRPAD